MSLKQEQIVLEEFKKKIISLLEELNKKMLERDELFKLLLLTVFSKSHIFLIGRPGVGKTDIISLIKNVFLDTRYFEYLI